MKMFIVRSLAAAWFMTLALCIPVVVDAQPAPELVARGTWNPATTYVIDDIVTARGSSWRSRRNNNLNKVPGQTQPSTANFWQLFARGFNPTGAWSNATTYQPDDLVTLNGQTYRAKRTHTDRPTSNTNVWELLAAKGEPGPNTGIGAGSAATPAISFTGDADTGIYSPQAGKIAIVENGALFLHNIGSNNTALGLSALPASTGASNTAVGAAALFANTTGGSNTAVGHSALSVNLTGNANTAFGHAALAANTTASLNTAIGSSALQSNTTGSSNTALGRLALADNTIGFSNVAVGAAALNSNLTGASNTAMGINALGTNTAGSSNTAIGSIALINATGSQNTALGQGALNATTTGNQNTAVGQAALQSNLTGSVNIAVGRGAGANPTAASNSIFIGSTGLAADTLTIKIGTQGTQTSAFMAGISNASAGGSGIQAYVDTVTGQLTGPPVSSGRLKEDIQPMGDVTALLKQLRPVTFRYTTPSPDGSKPTHYGLIAEEVAEVMPYLAVYNPDGTIRTVHYDRLPSFLLAGYQAQQNTIAVQAEKIEAQADELRRQKELNAALEARLSRIEALLPQTRAAALQ